MRRKREMKRRVGRRLRPSLPDRGRSLSGQEPGPALRTAQLEMIAKARKENTPDHPFLWAAFQYVK